MGKQKIGFLDEGQNTEISNCEFHGYDIGIKSKGKKLKSKNNKFFTYLKNNGWFEEWWFKFIIFPLFVGIILLIINKLL